MASALGTLDKLDVRVRPRFAAATASLTDVDRRPRGRSTSPSDVHSTFYGQLVQFGRVIPWETGIPVPHSAAAGR